jgi:hypothetical protein
VNVYMFILGIATGVTGRIANALSSPPSHARRCCSHYARFVCLWVCLQRMSPCLCACMQDTYIHTYTHYVYIHTYIHMYTCVYPTGFSFEWVAEKSTFRDAHGLTHLLHMLHVFNDADSGGLQMGIAHVLRNVFGPVFLCICVWPGIYICIYVCCR